MWSQISGGFQFHTLQAILIFSCLNFTSTKQWITLYAVIKFKFVNTGKVLRIWQALTLTTVHFQTFIHHKYTDYYQMNIHDSQHLPELYSLTSKCLPDSSTLMSNKISKFIYKKSELLIPHDIPTFSHPISPTSLKCITVYPAAQANESSSIPLSSLVQPSANITTSAFKYTWNLTPSHYFHHYNLE